jgi:hypothetical protein
MEWQNLESISKLILIQVCKWKEEREPNWVQKMNKLHTLGNIMCEPEEILFMRN